ncbi:MAG: helix-turn-helix transcriptional regulator [Geminicoccaceae bacterium]|nr:helix-turn-helix transcriptional regulator [Geminicoccaceae bacterium]
MTGDALSIGGLLRDWRGRRRLSQLALAVDAEVSQRHLSFIESGRAAPSREMVLRLAERLAVPLRERNVLLVAAGYAPVYRERGRDDAALKAAGEAVGAILNGHRPHPALAFDRHWTLRSANTPATRLMAGAAATLLEPPVNVLRLSLHPDGLAPRIANFRDWRDHVLTRLERQIEASADAVLVGLRDEFKSYPVPPGARPGRPAGAAARDAVAVPLELLTEAGTLRFLSTTTVFGTALDISLSELAVECFFPADEGTAAVMRALDEAARG